MSIQVIFPLEGTPRHHNSKMTHSRRKEECENGCIKNGGSCRACYNNKDRNVGMDSFTRICMYSKAITDEQLATDFQNMSDKIINPEMYRRAVRYLIHNVGLEIKIDKAKAVHQSVIDPRRTMVLDFPKWLSPEIYTAERLERVAFAQIADDAKNETALLRKNGDVMHKIFGDEKPSVLFSKKYCFERISEFDSLITRVSIDHPWCKNVCIPQNLSADCSTCPIPDVRGLISAVQKFPQRSRLGTQR